MIYLLYGTDIDKSRAKLHELVNSLLKKKPDASHLRMTDESFNEVQLEELISSPGLFSAKTIIEIDSTFKNNEAKDTVLGKLKDIAESENIFVFREEKLLNPELKQFEKYSEKIQEFDKKEKDTSPDKKRDFNIFSLTDALGKRDKKQLWVLYTKAKRKNIAEEEIHGILFWQVKAMMLAGSSKNAAEAGLNPFVYQKSKNFLNNFQNKDKELEMISSKLVSIYHDARRGIVDMSNALEKFILEM